MNYRHPYHAGNFADVVKHTVVARIIDYLKIKDSAFGAVDTHAGVGFYDLRSREAQRTGEAAEGIERVWQAKFSPATQQLLAPYLDCVAQLNEGTAAPTAAVGQRDAPVMYPGSPVLIRRLMRPQDRLVANEFHAEDSRELARLFARDRAVKVLALDGWIALKSLLPLKERRGVVLIDPPFEVPGEFERLVTGLQEGVRRFANGIFVLWYPIKDTTDVKRFHRALVETGIKKLLAIELLRHASNHRDTLSGTGLIVHNPPYLLKEELEQYLPELVGVLSTGPGAECRVNVLAGE
ncbi:MAG: 23S rRNA (adenine(2030)-N(6))-methyltransferase RlmJ [Hyphomicrobiaceae bacterium]